MYDISSFLSFNEAKAKIQKWNLNTMYYWYLLHCDLAIFEYENLPESIDPGYLERYLNVTGSVGIKRKGSEYILADISRDGDLNQYGLGDHALGNAINGDEISGTVGEDLCIIYNNPLHTPELDITIDAAAMADCQQSAGINVKFARIAPVFRTQNNVQSAALDGILNQILDGVLKTVVSGNAFQDDIMGLELKDNIDPIDITQPERIQYVQYLSRYHDDIMRRHFSRRGLAMRTPTKAAQQSDSEINGMDSVSWYYVLQKLESRKKGWAEFNRINGENVSVRLSEIWENELAAYKARKRIEDAQSERSVILDGESQTQDNSGSNVSE